MGKRLAPFAFRYLHLFILGGALIVSSVALVSIEKFNVSRLQAFGLTAQIYFNGVKNGLIIATTILFVSFIAATFFASYLKKIQGFVGDFYLSLTENKRNIFVLILCIVFAFASHAGNITHGYFNMDDFEVAGINHTTSFTESLLIPHGNDHTMPLFMAEMRGIDIIFGQNPIPYNTLVFLVFALIPFFTYLIFTRWNMRFKSFAVFLILFTGATNWADMLTGFNIMSTYIQIILFFSIALWSYIAWQQSKEKKYLAFFSLAVIAAITIDLPGIWVLPALGLYMAYDSWKESRGFDISRTQILSFLKGNFAPLTLLVTIALGFAIFLFVTFSIIQPHTFLSTLNGDSVSTATNDKAENWKLFPLATNFVSFFASGISLSLLAPEAAKILAHPAIQNGVKPFWPILAALITLGNVILIWFAFKYSSNKERKLIFFLFAVMSIIILMVIVARPNHEIIPDFDYRYAGAPFYLYCLFLSLCTSLLMHAKKEYAPKILFPLVIIIFSAQQAFSFYALRLKDEAIVRGAALTNLRDTLLPELRSLGAKDASLTIPNLAGASILEAMPGLTLADYLIFYTPKTSVTVIQNIELPLPDARNHTVAIVKSLRASTSPSFKQALEQPGAIRTYYTSSSLMAYQIATSSNNSITTETGDGAVMIHKGAFDPEKRHIVDLSFSTDNVSGNMELTFSFMNDFNVTGNAGKIRIDDYTLFTLQNDRRVYHMETDLLQLYTYALSEKISNLVLHIPKTKNASLNEASLQ